MLQSLANDGKTWTHAAMRQAHLVRPTHTLIFVNAGQAVVCIGRDSQPTIDLIGTDNDHVTVWACAIDTMPRSNESKKSSFA